MNFTLDDSSTEFAFSSGWAIQSASDPDLDRFFQSTYHVAEAVGASVNLSFSGTAVYIYGSKGPGHGSYSVQFDSSIITESAWANETLYQQLLFQRTFDTTNEGHFISFVANPGGVSPAQGSWIDIDFLVFTNGSSNTTSDAPVATNAPPWATTSSSTSASSSASSSATPSSSKSDTVSIALASAFGAILGLALLATIIYLILRRVYDTQHARERRFRYGPPSTTATPTPTNPDTRQKAGAGWMSPFRRGIPPLFATPSQATLHNAAVSGISGYSQAPLAPQSPNTAMSFEGSRQSNISSTVEREGDTARPDGRSTPGTTRGFLTSSPMQFRRQKPDDANSMRTDFLQV